MEPAERLTTTFVSALADLGLQQAALSPGSRNTPLSLALLAEPRIEVHTVLDERSGGFFALGAAKASGVPAAVVSTSGTAAANYLPAIIEARAARAPVLVLTADRPPELRGAGANQTIDQTKLYGDAVRLFHDVGAPDPVSAETGPALALRAWSAAADLPAGPVHLNFPFREPFPAPSEPAEPSGLLHVPGYRTLPPEAVADLSARLSGRRALIVAGGQQRPGFAAAAAMFSTQVGIPMIADIQCRFPSPASVVYAELLARAGALDLNPPEVVLRIGAIPTSNALWSWLTTTPVEQLYLDDGDWRDPFGTASVAYRADAAATLAEMVVQATPAPEGWLAAWRALDDTAADALHGALQDEPFPNEPLVARGAWQAAPPDSILYAGSSMPVRDLDAFAGPPRSDVAVLANRGASGIDGLLSSAAGATTFEGKRVVALTGDVAALHDANALELIGRESLPVTIVAINNDGGGIFSFLPQADSVGREHFDAAFAAPHGRSLAELAAAFGVPSGSLSSAQHLDDALSEEGPALLEVRTDREANVAVHQRLGDAVRKAVE